MHSEKEIADLLLQIKAIQLNTESPFLWASGISSPIYCDNRLVLSDVAGRHMVIRAFEESAKKFFPEADLVAGVATAGIAHAALLAYRLSLPLIYVRPKAKGHGKQNLIEGKIVPGSKAIVIEDLISTGGSSLKAVEALKEAGVEVLGVLAIFSYGMNKARQAFQEAHCPLHTLTNFDILLEQAIESGYLGADQLAFIGDWRQQFS